MTSPLHTSCSVDLDKVRTATHSPLWDLEAILTVQSEGSKAQSKVFSIFGAEGKGTPAPSSIT